MQNINTDPLATPVYLKTGDEPFPDDKLFYLLTADGLFICRNHPWFQSCAPAKTGPSDLAAQKSFCKPNYPLIPRVLIEKAVGFFHLINEKKHWESALILVWNRQTEQVELCCPPQEANSGKVEYKIPNLPPHQAVIGDLHCHMNWSPEPSQMDEHDEMNRPGLHIVVGHMKKEPPSFYACVVADGQRFEITEPKDLFEGYHQRNIDVPPEWEDMVKAKKWAQGEYGGGYGGYHSTGSGTGYVFGSKKPNEEDSAIISRELGKVIKKGKCPDPFILASDLFIATRAVCKEYCTKRAQSFVKNWDIIKKGGKEHEEEAHVGKE